MPYKVDQIKIAGTKYDRRVKIPKEEYQFIRNLYERGASKRFLSRIYGVDKTLISIILDPALREKRAEYSKKYSKDHRLTGEEHNKAIKETRRYKHQLYQEGKI